MRNVFAAIGLLSLLLCGTAQPASVTVAQGGGGDHTTVQAGIDAAGAGGTVTILDSATYVEDIVVTPTVAGITIQAATGQSPTIRAANTRLEDTYAALAITPPDRFGASIWAPCTIQGITFENLDVTANTSLAFGTLTACALAIHAPDVVVRDCTMCGPTTGFGDGDWSTCLIVPWGPTPATAQFDNCTFIGGEYGLVNETFGRHIPGWVTGEIIAVGCEMTSSTTNNVVSDAGVTNLMGCVMHSGQGNGISVGGGTVYLDGCDIVNNAGIGLQIEFNDSFALPGDFAVVTATDCYIAGNQGTGHNANIQLQEGTLTIDHSIIANGPNTAAIFIDDNVNAETASAPCELHMDFCDIYAPGQDCVLFDQDVNEHPITVDIKNSILDGQNGIINQNPGIHPMSVSYSSVVAVATALSGVTETANVAIPALYVDTANGIRTGFQYTNSNLNVGEAGAWIGSQGPVPTVTPPNPPSNAAAVALSSTQIQVSWDDNSTDEDGFRILRSQDDATYTEIGTVGANVTVYTDSGLNPGELYYYRIVAYNTAGDSAESNTASATTDATAGPIIWDYFDYADGNLWGLNGGGGWTGAWEDRIGSSANKFEIVSGHVEYTAADGSSWAAAQRLFPEFQDGKSYYISWDMMIPGTFNFADLNYKFYLTFFTGPASGTDEFLNVGVNPVQANSFWQVRGHSESGAIAPSTTTLPITTDTPQHIICQLDLNGQNDNAYFWFNPNPAVSVGPDTALLNIDFRDGSTSEPDRLSLDSKNGTGCWFDNIEVTTQPLAIRDLVANAGIGKVTLTWRNPVGTVLANLVIVRRTDRFPTNPADGTEVYNGTGTVYIDDPLNEGTYYYAAYGYDAAGTMTEASLAEATVTSTLDARHWGLYE